MDKILESKLIDLILLIIFYFSTSEIALKKVIACKTAFNKTVFQEATKIK